MESVIETVDELVLWRINNYSIYSTKHKLCRKKNALHCLCADLFVWKSQSFCSCLQRL